jgi:lysozyme
MHKSDFEIGIIYFLAVLFIVFRPSIEFDSKKIETYTENRELKLTEALNSTKTPYVGIDVSHYQNDVDWDKVKSAGVHYVFVKATEGDEYVDPLYHTNIAQLSKTNIPFSTYHFFEPKMDPIEQAKHYLSITSGSNQKIRPVLDVEITSGLEPSELRKRIKSWLKYVEDKTGCQPIFYTYGSFWNTNLKDEFSKYPLWLADYSSKIILPTGVTNWSIWQHTEKGKVAGIDSFVDMNLLNGENQKLEQLMCNL